MADDELYTRKTKVLATSAVWCDTHAEIHENSMNPYGDDKGCAGDQQWFNDHPHRRVFVERLKGDWRDEEL